MSQCSPILHTQGVMNVPFKMVLKVKQRPTLCHSMDYTVHGILQGQNTGVGSSFLLQGIFPTQGQNPGLLHCRQFLYQLSHQGSPNSFKIKAKLKVIAESFLLFPLTLLKKKKITGTIELGLETIPQPSLPTSPNLLLYQEYLVALQGGLVRPDDIIHGWAPWKYNGAN